MQGILPLAFSHLFMMQCLYAILLLARDGSSKESNTPDVVPLAYMSPVQDARFIHHEAACILMVVWQEEECVGRVVFHEEDNVYMLWCIQDWV